MDETVRSIQTALLDAIASEHRLRREALNERRETDRWERRADMAEQRELADLAAEARARVERHRRTASLYDRRAAEMRVQVDRLRDALAATQGHGRAPPRPAAASLESRIAALEVESDLERLRQERRQSRAANEVNAAESGQPEGG